MIGFGGVAYALGMLPILSWILVSPCLLCWDSSALIY